VSVVSQIATLPVAFSANDGADILASIFARASAPSLASIESFVTITLFSGIGLLLSLGVLIPDQYIPGEWF
jgi:hypothetical protein